MIEGSDLTLARMHRLDAKLDRMLSVLAEHTGRLHRAEGRLTSLAARFAVIGTFVHEVARMNQRLGEHGRRLAGDEDTAVLAKPPFRCIDSRKAPQKKPAPKSSRKAKAEKAQAIREGQSYSLTASKLKGSISRSTLQPEMDGSMALSYEDLDEITRPFMSGEIKNDVENGTIYLSQWLTQPGKTEWGNLLSTASKSHSDEWLANEIRSKRLLLESYEKKSPKGGTHISRVPHTGPDTMAEGEFNRFYCRGLCLRAIDDGIPYLEVYRAKQVANPRAGSEEKIGMLVDPKLILEDLRTSQGLEPALGVPPGPNSGLSLRIPKKR